MIRKQQQQKQHEQALDRIWGTIKHEYASNLRFLAKLGVTRMRIVTLSGLSYSTVERLVKELLEEGSVTQHWTHQHQSYWEAHYKPTGETVAAVVPDDDVSDIPF